MFHLFNAKLTSLVAVLTIFGLPACSPTPPSLEASKEANIASERQQTFSNALRLNPKRLSYISSRVVSSDIGQKSHLQLPYLQNLVDRLVAKGPLPNKRVIAKIANCGALGDHASPLGTVTFCKETLQTVMSESELAFVAGHEVAHVILRHGVGDTEKAKEDSDKAWLSYQFFGPNARTAALAQSKDLRSGYFRLEEREADLLGLDLMTMAGCNPLGTDSFLELLSRSNLGRWKFADEQKRQREKTLRYEMDKPNPDGGVASAYLLITSVDRAIASKVDDRQHDDATERRKLAASYIKTFYRDAETRPLGSLPWRTSSGELRTDMAW